MARKAFVVSFALTLAILLVFIVLTVVPFGQTPVEQIPADIEFQKKPWMSLVPVEVEHLAFLNYTEVKAVSRDYLPKGIVLSLVAEEISVGPEDVVYLGTLTLPNEGRDSTISEIVKPTQDAYTIISDKLRQAEEKEEYHGTKIYRVIDRVELATTQLIPGYIALTSGHVIFTAGDDEALRWLKLLLDTADNRRSLLFDDLTVRTVTYLAGNPKTGFSLIRFPGVVSKAETTVYGLAASSHNVLLKVVHSFQDDTVARSQANDVKRAYPSWDSYQVIENFVVASKIQGVESLPGLLNTILATP